MEKKRKRKYINRLKNFKLRLMLLVFVLGIGMLLFETISIYIAHADEFSQITIRQQVYGRRGHTDRMIRPNRGSIVDRNHELLAISHTVYNVFIDVRLLAATANNEDSDEIERTAYALYQLFGIDPERIFTYTAINPETERPHRDTHFLIVEHGVDPLREDELRSFNLLHVHAEEDTVRTYLAGTTTAAIVGFLSGAGVHSGIERAYDPFLSGTPGRLVRMFNEVGAVVTHQFRPETGYTVVTTLDLGLQQSAHQLVTEFGGRYRARTAQIIVMSPNTGEIYAMVQYPSFNNNAPFNLSYVTSLRLQAEFQEMTASEQTAALNNVWTNRAIAHSFEPGSIFKPIIHAAALEERLTYPGEQFFCPGYLIIAGIRINCWARQGHGHITLEQSMAVSCNVVSMVLGERLGRDLFYEYLRDFGVGQLTGIDISGEASFFPITYSRDQLNPVEIATASFGQGFNMTSIQSLVAFSAVINGGNMIVPYVVSQVIDGDRIIHENTPTIRRNVISQRTSDIWREAMIGTVEWYRGTGRQARIEGYLIGGKTGTAQVAERIEGMYTYTFITYLPVDNPRYVVLVNLERPEPDPGSEPVQRLSRLMLEEVIRQRGVRPGRTGNVPASTMVIVEDYVGQSFVEALTRITAKGLLADFIGNDNTVVAQTPLAVELVPRGTTVLLHVLSNEYAENLVTIPNLVGMTLPMMRESLQAVGLDYNLSPAPGADMVHLVETGTGVIISQSPQPGVRLPSDVPINLMVDSGAEDLITEDASAEDKNESD